MCKKQTITRLMGLGLIFLLVFVTQVQGQEWETILEDGFETDFPGPGWTRTIGAGGANYTWGRSNFTASSGDYSIWCAKKESGGSPQINPGAGYANNMDARAEYGTFDLTLADQAVLSFELNATFGGGTDYLEVNVNTGNGWQGPVLYNLNTSGWEHKEIRFENWPGLGNVMDRKYVSVQFKFKSDGALQGTGVFLDDVKIEKRVLGHPELEFLSFTTSQTTQALGELISVSGTVSNTGTYLSRATEVKIYLSEDANITTDDQYLSTAAVAEMNQGTTNGFAQNIRIPLVMDLGTYYVGAIIDPQNLEDELNEDNNTAVAANQLTLTEPKGWDIVLHESFEVDFPMGLWKRGADAGNYTWGRTYDKASDGEVSIWCADENLNGAPRRFPGGGYVPNMDAWADYGPFNLQNCTSATLSFEMWHNMATQSDRVEVLINYGQGWRGYDHHSDTDGWEYFYYDLTQWPGGGSVLGTQSVTLRFRFYSDAGATATGAFIDNVLIRRRFAKPDLICTSVVVDPTVLAPGTEATLTATMKNNDKTDSDSSNTIHYYLSTDNVISAAEDVLLGSDSVMPLPAWESHVFTYSATIPEGIPSGTYYIGAIVDQANTVDENVEDNNTTVSDPITVLTAAPDLVCSVTSFSPAMVDPGGAVAVNVNVQNAGDADAGATTVQAVLGLIAVGANSIKSMTVIGTANVDALAAGASTDVTINGTVPSDADMGTYSVGADVDPDNTVTEINEDNNSDTSTDELTVGDTGVDELKATRFELAQNYPNPFNPSTTISFSIAKPEDVQLTIYNTAGRTIRTLVNQHMAKGVYKMTWDGKNNAGASVASGVYFYQLKAGSYQARKKMIFME